MTTTNQTSEEVLSISSSLLDSMPFHLYSLNMFFSSSSLFYCVVFEAMKSTVMVNLHQSVISNNGLLAIVIGQCLRYVLAIKGHEGIQIQLYSYRNSKLDRCNWTPTRAENQSPSRISLWMQLIIQSFHGRGRSR